MNPSHEQDRNSVPSSSSSFSEIEINPNSLNFDDPGFGGNPNLNYQDNKAEPIDTTSDFTDIEIENREVLIQEEEEDGNNKIEKDDNNNNLNSTSSDENSRKEEKISGPLSQFPQPEAPPGLYASNGTNEQINQLERSQSDSNSRSIPAIGKFFRQRSSSLSSTLFGGISTSKDNNNINNNSDVTEINLSGVKVIVQMKNDDETENQFEFKGRISLFSRSNCRDCGAVRSFFREKGLKFVEININVYPIREKELIQRTGSCSVPQIFFNEKLLGGLEVINSLRNDIELEKKLKEMLGEKCPSNAPSVPVYGFDDQEEMEQEMDEMVDIIRVLRQKLPIQDRLMRLKVVKNCFAGNEMVEVIIHHLTCERQKAVAIGKDLAKKHFIHNVFGHNEFEDGNHYYRFLEHETFIPRCFNFRGSTNDCKPKSAVVVGKRLTNLMFAILESYASEDRRHLDYASISNSEEFRRYFPTSVLQKLTHLSNSNS